MRNIVKKVDTKIIFITTFVLIIVSYFSFDAEANEINKIKLVLTKIVYETEEGYVSTNIGNIALPNPSTEIYLDSSSLALLVNNLNKYKGKEIALYIDSNTVVGISVESDGFSFAPKYIKKTKITYNVPPFKISTKLRHWYTDTYRLSLITNNGTFCIFNAFEVSDYYKRVYDKLKKSLDTESNLNVDITIYYQKIEDSSECVGEIEDIEL